VGQQHEGGEIEPYCSCSVISTVCTLHLALLQWARSIMVLLVVHRLVSLMQVVLEEGSPPGVGVREGAG
jgi:hypothetical protein